MSKIRPKECQNVEFKRIWKDEYLKWICGFANAQGAVIYFGVDDDHEVYGRKHPLFFFTAMRAYINIMFHSISTIVY